MNRSENVFIAKRMLIDNIYRSAKLEGLGVTFAQTEQIVENLSADVKPSDINHIICLKRGWDYILSNLDSELDLGLVKNCHTIIGAGLEIPLCEIGEFRRSGVGIGGTTWRPETPNTEKLHLELLRLKEIPDLIERGITVFCWTMRSQMFRDGNKRVASLVANFELIKHGAGIISVPEQHISEFKILLVKYYESNNLTEITEFLKHYCFYDDMEFLSNADRQK